jgi:NADPH-dependent F420 reductase
VQVGVLGGTGPAGRALAARLASSGVETVIGSRSEERANEIVESVRGEWPAVDLAILRGGGTEAAADADVVVVATPWDAAGPTVRSVAERLDGKVVVSMANALTKIGLDFQPLIPPRGSVAAEVQHAAPGALVSAAFHHLPAKELGALDHELDADVLVCSDHPAAIEATAALVTKMPGLRALDAGRLSSAGAIESLTAVLLQLNVRYKTRATVSFGGISLP